MSKYIVVKNNNRRRRRNNYKNMPLSGSLENFGKSFKDGIYAQFKNDDNLDYLKKCNSGDIIQIRLYNPLDNKAIIVNLTFRHYYIMSWDEASELVNYYGWKTLKSTSSSNWRIKIFFDPILKLDN